MMRVAVVLALVLVLASAAGAVTSSFDRIELAGPLSEFNEGSGGGGHGGTMRRSLLQLAETAIDSLDRSDGNEITSAVIDIESATRANATRIANALKNANDLSAFVRAAHDEAGGTLGAGNGVRTNLSIARGTDGLAQAVIALHREVGSPLSAAQETTTLQQTALVNPNAAKASALIIFATIDAMHYRAAAFAGVDQSSLDTVMAEPELLSMLHRRMNFQADGNSLHLTFDANTTRVIEAAINVTNSLPPTAIDSLYQALDVLSQATEEARSLLVPTGTLPSTQHSEFNCARAPQKVVFESPDCKIVIGGDEGTVYDYMRIAQGEKNTVLVDFGGADTYMHRAGGGRGTVQVLVDLKNGNDIYDRSALSAGNLFESYAAQGSGSTGGVGFLFDEGGNDRYRAIGANGQALQAQGGALFGAGMLVDNGGDDTYYAAQKGAVGSHGQGTAVGTAVGILRDSGGQDTYTFESLPRVGVPAAEGGGAQGYAAMTGGAYFVDMGNAADTYAAGQDEVQGAASTQGFAIFYDDGGANTLRVKSSLGCPKIHDGVCSDSESPIAGWSQGYADTNGTAFLVLGTGADRLEVLELEGDYERPHEGRALMGIGNTTALGALINLGGNDVYEARNESFGNGNSGLGVFADVGGADTYSCSAVTCYGDGTSLGAGVFYDGVSSGDSFADGNSRLIPWARGDIGIGVHQGS